ncbi:MAG: hypothetical protein ACR2OU_08415 [Thermomicrobiales bacterium]
MSRTKVADELYQLQGLSRITSHWRVRIYTADDLVPVVIASECVD